VAVETPAREATSLMVATAPPYPRALTLAE
jgi:hypothetical protein